MNFDNLTVSGTTRVEVTVHPRDVLETMLHRVCNGYNTNEVEIRNGELYHAEDISYHGSPSYQYTRIGGKLQALMYRQIQDLLKTMNAYDECVEELSTRR